MEYTFDIDELIAKRLAVETTEQENAQLDLWLSESPDNQHYFSQMQRLWEHSGVGKNTLPDSIDVERALEKTKQKIQHRSEKSLLKITGLGSWWLAAAATIVMVISAIWFFQPFGGNAPEVIAATEKPLHDTLVDGSIVALNQQSSLITTFNNKSRRVKMQGEAYFQVAPDPGKPFVIDVKSVEVTVVGTKFNIDNRSDSTKIIVSVEEGKVRVQSGNQTVYLMIGDQATIDCLSGQIFRSKLPASGNIKGWLDRRFVFDDVPLSEVIPILESAYCVHIELKNKDLGKCRLRTRFNDEPIQRVIEVIAETFSLQIVNVNGRYLLDGAGCGQ